MKDYASTNFAARQDLKDLESRMELEFEKVRFEIRELRNEVHSLQDRLTIRIGGMMVVGFGVLGAALKLIQ